MPYTNLISASQLVDALGGTAPPLVLDCGFDLTDAAAGRRAHAAGHIRGAAYVHLEETLSGAKNGRNGRHPLPSREAFAQSMATLGLDRGRQVVAYDNAGGMYAARLWWMLRWAGHAAVAVLDGGLAAWQAAGQPLSHDAAVPPRTGDFALGSALVSTVSYETVLANLQSAERLVLDARAPDRFRGENETLDAVGGHIPGARNRFFKDNLGPAAAFKPAAQLRDELTAVAGNKPAADLIFQCGSGVTACHNLLAMDVAGLPGAQLYAGSWSEWSAQPGAPVATGAA